MNSTRSATINDVAAAAGVSRAAVSKVIRNAYGVSPAMRERVMAAIEELDYRPRTAARALRGATFTIGFAIPQMGNEFLAQLINGALATLTGTGYQLIIAPESTETSGTQMLSALDDRQVDGIIAVTPGASPDWLERLAARTPLVLIGRHDPSLHYDTVTGRDAVGARLVMEHLLDLGHRRIAHLTSHHVVEETEPTDPHAVRLATYRSVMQERGLVARDLRVVPDQPHAAEAAAEMLTWDPPPTAIFAAHDTLALGALIAIGEANVDIAVAGYDGTPITAHPRMSVTTVDQDGPGMGAAAARLILERIEGRIEPVHYESEPRLVARASTASVPVHS